MQTWRVLVGDVRERLRELPDASVQMCVTSPPYWGLRDYGQEGQLGLEQTPDAYVTAMQGVFREVLRVLRPDGVLFLNIGDCYATGAGAVGEHPGGGVQGARWRGDVARHRDERRRDYVRPATNGRGEAQTTRTSERSGHEGKHEYRIGPLTQPNRMPLPGLKPKDLIGIPWMLAFALRSDGWYLRSDNIWSKPNPMPESVADRTTKAHEYVFMLTKSGRPLLWRHRDTRAWADVQPAPDYVWVDKVTEEETAQEPEGWRSATFVENGRTRKRFSRINRWRGFDYFYDGDAIKEQYSLSTLRQFEDGYNGQARKAYDGTGAQNPSDVKRRIVARHRNKQRGHGRRHDGFNDRWDAMDKTAQSIGGANRRSVWTIATQPYEDAHFATFPEALPDLCIRAGSRVGDVVLDPFTGSGTTGAVASKLGRSFVGIELNPAYAELARKRIGTAAPLFAQEASA